MAVFENFIDWLNAHPLQDESTDEIVIENHTELFEWIYKYRQVVNGNQANRSTGQWTNMALRMIQ